MILTTSAAAMAKAAKFVRLVTDVKSSKAKTMTMTMLRHVLIRPTSEGYITLAGTDLTTWAFATLPGVRVEGEPRPVCLPIMELLGLLKGVKDGDVVIKVQGEDAHATVRCGEASTRLPTLAPEDMPTPPDEEAPEAFAVHGDDLARVIDVTTPAMSTDTCRSSLHGLHMAADKDRVRVEASDGHWLATTTCPGIVDQPCDMLVPYPAVRALAELARTSGHLGVRVYVATYADGKTRAAERAWFRGDGFALHTKVSPGSVFPDIEQVMPKADEETFALHINKKRLLAIKPKRYRPYAAFEAQDVPDGGDVPIVDGVGDGSDGSVRHEGVATCVLKNGKSAWRFLLTLRYLQDIARSVNEKSLRLSGRSTLEPFWCYQPNGDRFVVMPVRV